MNKHIEETIDRVYCELGHAYFPDATEELQTEIVEAWLMVDPSNTDAVLKYFETRFPDPQEVIEYFEGEIMDWLEEAVNQYEQEIHDVS